MNSHAVHDIQSASRRSGLPQHVIRAWERRYAAISPTRTPSKRRVYSAEDIEKLQMLSQAVRAGHTIGRIASLTIAELRDLIAVATPRADGAPINPRDSDAWGGAVLEAVERFDAHRLDTVLREARVELGAHGFLVKVIAPVAKMLGDKWAAGDSLPGHEHFFTASVKVALGSLTYQYASSGGPTIVVGTPTGQLHELGAYMAAAAAAHKGWRVIYLGSSLPAADLAAVVRSSGATAVALGISYPLDDAAISPELLRLRECVGPAVAVIAGGAAVPPLFETLLKIRATYAATLDEFIEVLESLRAPHANRSTSTAPMKAL